MDVFNTLDSISEKLEKIVVDAGGDGWAVDTPAPGWTVAHQVAHLTWTDEVSLLAITDREGFAEVQKQAEADPTGFVDAGAEEIAVVPRDELLDRWRTARRDLGKALSDVDPGEKLPWFGPPMRSKSMATARVMETWAHGIDITDALGVDLDTDEALPHVARIGFRTRDFAYIMNSLEPPTDEFRVVLTDGEGGIHDFGPAEAPQVVTGSLRDFCLLVTQRIHRADTDLVADGVDAEKWLTLAQAFAGLPGAGRREGERA